VAPSAAAAVQQQCILAGAHHCLVILSFSRCDAAHTLDNTYLLLLPLQISQERYGKGYEELGSE
jgi:hypothetical protein